MVFTLRFLYAGVPFIAYLVGAYLLGRFAFNEEEHKHVQSELEIIRRDREAQETTS